jgi:hypothetical protein
MSGSTAKSPNTESSPHYCRSIKEEREEALKHCRCDGIEGHGHCVFCRGKVPEGGVCCAACDLKKRNRTCPACDGEFYVAKRGGDDAPFNFRGQGVCSPACQERLFNDLLSDSGLPPAGLKKTLGNFHPHSPEFKRKLARLTAWKDAEPSTGLIFLGPVGTGKTHLACALMVALCRRGLDGKFITCCDFTLRCQFAYSDRETVPGTRPSAVKLTLHSQPILSIPANRKTQMSPLRIHDLLPRSPHG